MAPLNSRIPRPIERPTSGSFLGPMITSAMIRTITSSIGPMFGILSPLALEEVLREGGTCRSAGGHQWRGKARTPGGVAILARARCRDLARQQTGNFPGRPGNEI